MEIEAIGIIVLVLGLTWFMSFALTKMLCFIAILTEHVVLMLRNFYVSKN